MTQLSLTHSPLPAPLAFGCWTAPQEGAEAGRDAPRMQFSTG